MESTNSMEPILEESSPDDSSIEDLGISSNIEEFLFQSDPEWKPPKEDPKRCGKNCCKPDDQYKINRTISKKLQKCILDREFDIKTITEGPTENLKCINSN